MYELSKTENGVSKIRVYKSFIDKEEADGIFETLKTELLWQKRVNTKFNLEEPRLTSWQGEHRYIYLDIEWPPAAVTFILKLISFFLTFLFKFSKTTEMLRNRLNEFLDYKLNSVLANFYRDGRDTVPWHSDDEPMLGKNPLIASLTFGATRTFELRRKLGPEATENDYENVEHLKVPLENGSLVIMEGACQEDWEVGYW